MGRFVRYVFCWLQFWISLGQHLLELRTFILLILSYSFSRYFVFVIYPSPQSWRHGSWVQQVGVNVFLFSSGFGFSYQAVPHLGFLCSLMFCDGEYYNQVYADTLMAVCNKLLALRSSLTYRPLYLYCRVCVYLSSVGKMKLFIVSNFAYCYG